jgi:hypothetical protein
VCALFTKTTVVGEYGRPVTIEDRSALMYSPSVQPYQAESAHKAFWKSIDQIFTTAAAVPENYDVRPVFALGRERLVGGFIDLLAGQRASGALLNLDFILKVLTAIRELGLKEPPKLAVELLRLLRFVELEFSRHPEVWTQVAPLHQIIRKQTGGCELTIQQTECRQAVFLRRSKLLVTADPSPDAPWRATPEAWEKIGQLGKSRNRVPSDWALVLEADQVRTTRTNWQDGYEQFSSICNAMMHGVVVDLLHDPELARRSASIGPLRPGDLGWWARRLKDEQQAKALATAEELRKWAGGEEIPAGQVGLKTTD